MHVKTPKVAKRGIRVANAGCSLILEALEAACCEQIDGSEGRAEHENGKPFTRFRSRGFLCFHPVFGLLSRTLPLPRDSPAYPE